jgi:hypothetical protein
VVRIHQFTQKTLEFMERGLQVPSFFSHFLEDALYRRRCFGKEISDLFAGFEGYLEGKFRDEGLLFDELAIGSDGKPARFASTYMESCLFETMAACSFGAGEVSYRDAVMRCVPKYFSEELARFVVGVSPLRFALWSYLIMRKTDGDRNGYDMDFVELVCMYMLRDQIYTGALGRHIGDRAKEWSKMIKGPNIQQYGVIILGDLYYGV